MEEAKGEVNAEIHPELCRQIAGERDFLREQRAKLILQLSRKGDERRRKDFEPFSSSAPARNG